MNLTAPILAAAAFLFSPHLIDHAQAQQFPDDRGLRTDGALIELYPEVGYGGDQVTVRQDQRTLAALGLEDRVASVRVFGGAWRLCEERQFAGRCVEVSQDEPDLARIGMAFRASSVQRVDRESLAGGPDWREDDADWDTPQADDEQDPAWRGPGAGAEAAYGRTAAFFPQPSLRGEPLPACDSYGQRGCIEATARRFCRSEGYQDTEYYTVRRTRRGEALEDVLCVR